MTDRDHVVVACDKFKGSLTAGEVVEIITAGLREGAPGVEVGSVIVADGGDGTVEAAVAAGFDRVPVRCAGPTGEPVETGYAVRAGGESVEAVVEMADACGLIRLPGGRRDALGASSRGLGELIAAVLDSGATSCSNPFVSQTEGAGPAGQARVDRLVIGIGGSASTDGGAGMLAALGARLTGPNGIPLPDGGGALLDLEAVDLSGLHPRLREVEIVVACDVDNPLLGEQGAAAVFAPQKGAGPDEVARLEAGLARLAELVGAELGRDDTGRPGAGAAGGVGWAAMAVLGATMRPGIDLVLDLAGFDGLVRGARLVVTGEGSLDEQTLLGKAPAGVATRSRAAGVPVVAVCGRSLLRHEQASAAGFAEVRALTDLEPDSEVCMRDAARLLRQLAAGVGADLDALAGPGRAGHVGRAGGLGSRGGTAPGDLFRG